MGATVGENTFFFDPFTTKIDIKRAEHLYIGEKCKITQGVQFLCHDYSWSVLHAAYKEILPMAGKNIEIGDNVFIGWNTLVLGGVKIGSNVIVGANSVVTHDICSNSVVAGNPAKVVCSLEEYYCKRKEQILYEAKREYLFLLSRHKYVLSSDMGWFQVLWLARTEENAKLLEKLPFRGDSKTAVLETFLTSEQSFDSYEEFQNFCEKKG